MPSGAKKRKAAKKKKGSTHHHHHHHHHRPYSADVVHSHGDDDLKHHDDEKESDGEEVSSPASSQDHPNNHHQFTDEEKEEVEKAEISSDVQVSKDNKSFGGVKEVNEVVKIEPEVKPADVELSSKNEIVEIVESQSVVQIETESKSDTEELSSETAFVENVAPRKEATNGVLLQSIDGKSVVQIESDPKPTNDELNRNNAIAENVDPSKTANDGSMDQGSVAQTEADLKTMIEPEINNVTDDEPEAKNVTVDEPETKNITDEHAEHLKGSTDGDLLQSQHEEPHVIDKPIMELDIARTSVSADGNGEMMGNGVMLQERNGKMPMTSLDLGPDNRRDEAIVKTDEIVATSDAKNSASREIGDKLISSYNVPAIETATAADSTHSTNYAEHIKNPEVPKSSDREPLVPSAPQVVQRTSLMSCCGLFGVFSRS